MTAAQQSALRNAQALLQFGQGLDFEQAAMTLRDLKRQGLSDHEDAKALRANIHERFGRSWGDTYLFNLGAL